MNTAISSGLSIGQSAASSNSAGGKRRHCLMSPLISLLTVSLACCSTLASAGYKSTDDVPQANPHLLIESSEQNFHHKRSHRAKKKYHRSHYKHHHRAKRYRHRDNYIGLYYGHRSKHHYRDHYKSRSHYYSKHRRGYGSKHHYKHRRHHHNRRYNQCKHRYHRAW